LTIAHQNQIGMQNVGHQSDFVCRIANAKMGGAIPVRFAYLLRQIF
jgi:hypothetical protein